MQIYAPQRKLDPAAWKCYTVDKENGEGGRLTEHTLYFVSTDGELPMTEALLCCVSPTRRAKIAALRRTADRENALLAALVVRLSAAERLGVGNGDLHFAVTACGKPYLSGKPDFHFSLAHTEGAVVLAVSSLPVGVDVERIRPAPHGVAERFFTPAERAFCGTSDTRFFEVWTRKEALAKRVGDALCDVIASLDTAHPAAAAETRIFRTDAHISAVASTAAAAFSLRLLPGEELISRALSALQPLG